MKKVTVILAHENLNKESLMNKTIMDVVKSEMPSVEWRHLDSLYPNGKMNVEAEQKALVDADIIVMQFPIYWRNVPAILKAYMDQVWTYGFAFGPGGDKLTGKKLYVVASTGPPESFYTPAGFNKHYLKDFLIGLEYNALFTGMTFGGVTGAHCAGMGPDFASQNKDIATAAARKLVEALKAEK